jgi:hypothetical protein
MVFSFLFLFMEIFPYCTTKLLELLPIRDLVVAGQYEKEDIQMEIKGNFEQIGVILNPGQRLLRLCPFHKWF